MISSPSNGIGLISSPGDGIDLSLHYEYFILFSTCWNISPCLHFLEIGIIQFINLSSSFSGLINLHLSNILVGYKNITISVSAAALAILSQVLLSRFFYIVIQVVDF